MNARTEDPIRTHRIAVVPGDGIGPEVVDASRPALLALAKRFRFKLEFTEYGLGAAHFTATGELLTDEKLDALRRHDAVFFGAMGDPSVKPGLLERGVILKMRVAFQQAANVRPVRLYPGVQSPMKSVTPENCDLIIVRENTEGSYVGGGSTMLAGTPYAVATQDSVNTAFGIHRVVDFAFRLAMQRRKRLTLCHKKNVLVHAGELWQQTVDTVGRQYPEVTVDYVHVDAMCFHLPLTPERFDVVVTDNLFGDIITDLGAMIQGGLGVSASANLNLDGNAPSMFEPIHGSAPDIAGKGWANPIGALLSGAMMLSSLGEPAAAGALESAAVAVLAQLPGPSGPSMQATTAEVGQRVADRILADATNGSTLDLGSTINTQLCAVLHS